MWPWAVAFILPNELGERFGFFGTRALLNQYLKAGFGLRDEEAKSYVHLFNGLVCIFPVVGGAISDSYLGKFNTAVVFYLVALIGNMLLSVLAIDGVVGEFGKYPIWAFLIPAVLITMGSGCAKPCAVSLAGDQFKDMKGLDKFYSIHSMMMNIGILLAVTLIPFIKGSSGYPLAYAAGTGVLLVSLGVLVCGKASFTIVPPHGEFLPWKIAKLVSHAAARKLKGHAAEDWLELASDLYDEEMIQEARQFLRVFVILLPLIFMWVLHEQNITEWQNQYDIMDKNMLGITIPTESSSLAAALMIVFLLPVMGYLVFPGLERRGLRISLGARVAIGYGCFLSAFFISTILQYKVSASASNRVRVNNVAVSCEGCVSGAWQLPQWLLFSIGESIMGPNLGLLAYSNVGPKLKASAMSLILLTIAVANFFVIGMEPVLVHLQSGIDRQWCYVSISSVSFVAYLLLLKFWFIPTTALVSSKELEIGEDDFKN
ncbi:hypothetical protein DSO57_1036274 [Entomophthora muscae]|uniref:Uncharacterized protein n=1 Tax=Entomophthora muscae TaxID=34485 RepID=A0ACC2TLF5_9FUNG|nr:hypothetical protein DSO57_1036274 [Entomophthora muscae]